MYLRTAPVRSEQWCAMLRSNNLTLPGVIQLDPWLSPFKDALRSRYSRAQKWIKTIEETEGGLDKFSKGYEKFGFNVSENGDIVYREWAPNAMRAYLIGDFSTSSPLARLSLSLTISFRWMEQRCHTHDKRRIRGVGSQITSKGWPASYTS